MLAILIQKKPKEASDDVKGTIDLECFLVETIYDQLEQFKSIHMPPTGMHGINSYFDLIVKPQPSVEGLDGTMINIQKTRMDSLVRTTFATVKILSEIAKADGKVLELDREFIEIITARLFDTNKEEKGFEFKSEFTFVFLNNMLKTSTHFNVDADKESCLMLVEPKTVEQIVVPREIVIPASLAGTPLFGDEATNRLKRFIDVTPREGRRFAEKD